VKNSVAGFIMGPLPKAVYISTKKMPNSTKVTQKKGHHNLVKVTFFLFWVLHQGP
jgi:hypothetical protein